MLQRLRLQLRDVSSVLTTWSVDDGGEDDEDDEADLFIRLRDRDRSRGTGSFLAISESDRARRVGRGTATIKVGGYVVVVCKKEGELLVRRQRQGWQVARHLGVIEVIW